MIDLRIVETGNGGDLALLGNDFAKANSFENMVYLAMFGGNVGFSTPKRRANDEQAFDYWANSLLFADSPELQFNSETEKALGEISFTSNGRQILEQAIKTDLKFMQPYANVSVNVTILTFTDLQMKIDIIKPDNKIEKQFIFIWDGFNIFEEEIVYTPKVEAIGLEEIIETELG